MFNSTDEVVDKIITILKEHLPTVLDGIDASLDDINDGTGGTENCYYFGDVASLPTVYPAISVRPRAEDFINMDLGHLTPLKTLAVEMEFVCAHAYEQTLNRNTIKYARAITEIIELHKTLDNTVASCEIVSIVYSNLWQVQEGGNLYKAIMIELSIKKI